MAYPVMQQEPMGSFLSEAIPAGYSDIRDKIRNFPQIPWGRIPQTFRDNQRPITPGGALRGALGSIPLPSINENPIIQLAMSRAGLGTAEPPMQARAIPRPMLPPMPTPMPTPMPMRMATPVPQPQPAPYIPLPAHARPPTTVDPNSVDAAIFPPARPRDSIAAAAARILKPPTPRIGRRAARSLTESENGVMDLYME